jgi:hypothetical protein
MKTLTIIILALYTGIVIGQTYTLSNSQMYELYLMKNIRSLCSKGSFAIVLPPGITTQEEVRFECNHAGKFIPPKN